ncbi:AAA family ATPase [Colletotrichum asianum]
MRISMMPPNVLFHLARITTETWGLGTGQLILLFLVLVSEKLLGPLIVALQHLRSNCLGGRLDCGHQVLHTNLYLLLGAVSVPVRRQCQRLLHRRLRRDVDNLLNLGAGEALGQSRQLGQVHVRRGRQLAEVQLEDGLATGVVRRADVHDAVETPGAEQRGVHLLRPVGGRQDEHAREGLKPVHLGEQRREHVDGALALGAAAGALSADGVDLVKEDDARAGRARAFKELSDGTLRLAHVHVEELGALDGKKVETGLGGHGLR